MIGRFLEVGLSARHIMSSIAFYEELGFQQLSVGDIWPHPYAVLSDGAIHIGLHDAPLNGPVMTFVLPNLADEIPELRSRGVVFELSHTSDDLFNEVVFSDPDGHPVRIVEARTFSPPPFEQQNLSLCGRFREISLAVRDLETSMAFWQRLGFEELDTASHPHPHCWLRGQDIVLGLHQNYGIESLALSFHNDDLASTIELMEARGIAINDSATPAGVSMLTTPEKLPILLLGS